MQSSTFKAFNGKLQKPIGLFTYFRIRKLTRKWRKRTKNSKHRLYVLREWIATQKSYIKDLKIIQQEIRKPLVQNKPPVITKEQQMTMFANVDVIIMLSSNLYEQLAKLEKKWNPLTTLIGPILISLHAFFKIYLQYCNLFYKGQTVLKQIKYQPVVHQIQKKLPLDISSYLIKPVQRPPKYELLLRDYLKHMPQTHPDHKNILQAVKKYHEVNEINNQAIAREARVERMFYLAKLYDELLSSTREFVNQFQATIFEEPVKLYVLSDMLLITKEVEGKQSLMKVILLDWTSFVKRNPDGKYFLNKVFVCGRTQCANISFVTNRSADTVVDTLKSVIDKLYKKDEERRSLIANVSWKRPEVKVRVTLAERRIEQLSYQPRFRVNVEGVEKRPLSKFNDETFYVIKYQLPRPWKMCQYVYTQLETIEEVQKIVRKKVPSITAIKLRSDSIKLGTLEQTRNKTRIIEYRELAITQMLNYILRNDKVMANPLSLIEKLHIDENLWTLAVDQTRDKCTCSSCLRNMAEGQLSLDKYIDKRWNHYVMKHSQLTSQDYCLKKYLIDKMNLLKLHIEQFNSLDRMLLYLDTLQGRIDYTLIYKQRKPDTSSVKVWFQNVSFKQFIEIKINKETRVGEVMTLVGRDFGMQFMNDFGLFVSYSDRPRLLDSDEILYEVMRQTESEVEDINSKGFFWDGIINVKKWGQQVIRGKKSRLYIRKYLYLPKQFENASWHGSFQRQLLVLQQTLYDIKRGYLQLSDEELQRMAANFVCLKELDRIAHVKSSNFPWERVKQIIPNNRLELLTDNVWIKSVIDLFEKKKLAIVSMKEKVQILCDEMLNVTQEKPLWSTYIVEAENYDPTTLKGNRPFITLGVSPCNFSVYGEGSTTALLSIPLLQLNYKVTVFSIFITYDDKSYRFDAPMLFNFSRIIEKYKLMNKLVANGN